MTTKHKLSPCPSIVLPSLLVWLAIALTLSSCRARPPAAAADAPAHTAPGAAARTGGIQQPLRPYDPGIYGDLEHLDPTGQTVVYWHPHAGSQDELLHRLVDEFNATNPWQITVLAEAMGSSDRLHETILDRLAARRTPTLAEAHAHQIAAYAARDAVVPFDYYVYSAKWGYSAQELADFFAAALAMGYLPQFGATYGWPLERSEELLFTNADWLVELGYQTPPQTWDEFAEMACAAAQQSYSDAKGDGTPLGFAYPLSARTFTTLVASRGGNMVSSDGALYTFNEPEGLATLTMLRDLTAQGCARPLDNAAVRSEFSSGHVLFVMDSADLLSQYEQTVDEGAGFEWIIEPLPHGSEPRMSVHGLSFVTFRTTPEEQLAAWLFARWMSEPEQQAQWAAHTGHYPSRRSAGALLAPYFAENPPYERALRLFTLDYAPEPAVAGYDRCSSAIATMLSQTMAGRDAQGELSIAVNQCNIISAQARR